MVRVDSGPKEIRNGIPKIGTSIDKMYYEVEKELNNNICMPVENDSEFDESTVDYSSSETGNSGSENSEDANSNNFSDSSIDEADGTKIRLSHQF